MRKLNNILVVDDENDMLAITKISLQNVGGFSVSTATNVTDALSILKKNEPKHDMILLDIVMPEIDGMAALKMFRVAKFVGPIVVMTARVNREELDTYLALGADGIVTKPFDVTTLATQLEQLWISFGERQ